VTAKKQAGRKEDKGKIKEAKQGEVSKQEKKRKKLRVEEKIKN
jgi:hypothetical protein